MIEFTVFFENDLYTVRMVGSFTGGGVRGESLLDVGPAGSHGIGAHRLEVVGVGDRL